MSVCEICGCELEDGFTDGDVCVCEEHFDAYMDAHFGDWRQNDHEDEPHWHGGYYDYDESGIWRDSGFYWTEGMEI